MANRNGLIMIELNPLSSQAYDLLHQGTLAFARAERHGIRVDVKYIQKTKKKLTRNIQKLEEEFKNSKFYKEWNKSIRGTPNINSGKQLRDFLYKTKKHKIKKKTKSGLGSTDKETLTALKIPELEILLRIKQIEKIRDTYLEAFNREQVDGIMHPFFPLNTVLTYRSSSNAPNFQNIPKRDEEAQRICRNALFPSKGNQLLEVDYSGIEVSIASCYHQDKRMLKYLNNPKTNMHTDLAKQIFKIKNIDLDIKEHDRLRYIAKNGFVFPQFYGDYYKNCAENMACKALELPKGKWKPRQGIKMPKGTISDHLIKNGFKNYVTFEEHIKELQFDFWKNRFPGYAKWKEKWYEQYQQNGYIDLKTGFRCSGVMSKNEVTNYPVQGAAFHCLLWSFIRLDEILYRDGWKSRIIGQIHDAIIFDVYPPELDKLLKLVNRVTTQDLRKAWDWINVPLSVDAELCPVDGSWAEKEKYKFN